MEEIGLVLLLITLPVLLYLTSRVRAGKAGQLRSLPGMDELPGSVGHSAETGRPLHVSVGTGGVGGVATAETWAGLSLLTQMADEAAACDTPLIVTVSDATVLPIAQDILQRAYARNRFPYRDPIAQPAVPSRYKTALVCLRTAPVSGPSSAPNTTRSLYSRQTGLRHRNITTGQRHSRCYSALLRSRPMDKIQPQRPGRGRRTAFGNAL